jgi:hypothetical protein
MYGWVIFFFLIVIGGDHSTLPLIHDIIVRIGCLVTLWIQLILQDKISGHPYSKNSIWSRLVIPTQGNMILFTQQITQTQQSTVYSCVTNHSTQFECWNFFSKQHAICRKAGIRNDDATQVTHVLYTHCSSNYRPAKILRSYNTPINYYGRYKFGLQLNETLMSNHSQRFKFSNDTVASNLAEGLKWILER